MCVCVRACACVRALVCMCACELVCVGFCSQCARNGRFISAASMLGTVDLFWQPVC